MRDKIAIIKEKIKDFKFVKQVPKERIIVGALLILLAGFLLYRSLIAVHVLRLKAVEFQFKSQKELSDFYRGLMEDENAFVNLTKKREEAFEKIKERFISEGELSNYFDDFRAIVESYDLEVQNLDFNPQEVIMGRDKKQFSVFRSLSFEASLKGGYFDALSLLYKLEHNKHIFDIESIYISNVAPESSIVTMEMKVKIYILLKGT